jgi:hypothetical protein
VKGRLVVRYVFTHACLALSALMNSSSIAAPLLPHLLQHTGDCLNQSLSI